MAEQIVHHGAGSGIGAGTGLGFLAGRAGGIVLATTVLVLLLVIGVVLIGKGLGGLIG